MSQKIQIQSNFKDTKVHSAPKFSLELQIIKGSRLKHARYRINIAEIPHCIESLKNITRLELCDNDLTKQQIMAYKKAFPDCSVEWFDGDWIKYLEELEKLEELEDDQHLVISPYFTQYSQTSHNNIFVSQESLYDKQNNHISKSSSKEKPQKWLFHQLIIVTHNTFRYANTRCDDLALELTQQYPSTPCYF